MEGRFREAPEAGPAPVHPQADVIVGVVQELLESGGYDGVQLREVARRARVSLSTIYRLCGLHSTHRAPHG